MYIYFIPEEHHRAEGRFSDSFFEDEISKILMYTKR
jgi:hypothetical protein